MAKDIWTDGYQEGFIDGLSWALKFRDPKIIKDKIKEIQEDED